MRQWNKEPARKFYRSRSFVLVGLARKAFAMFLSKTSVHLVLAAVFVLASYSGVTIKPADAATRAVKQRQAPPAQSNQTPNGIDESRRFSAQDQDAAIVPGFSDARFFASSEQDFFRALPQSNGAKSGAWLALSAGGVDGAFGAGLLNGWSARGARPDFAVVTGVSAGALIAPYAFLGSRYDDQLRTALTTITDADVFEAGQTPLSLLDTWPLRRLLEKRITPEMLADIAAEHHRGRRLFVVTTNLDAGRAVVWNMGAIAARRDDTALKLFRDVLLASAALPGVFPPVFIEVEANGHRFREMHADGGIGGPFFAAPESWLVGTSQTRLPTRQLYIIVNGKLTPEFEVTPSSTSGVLGRSFSAAVKTGTRVEIANLFAAAQRDSIDIKVAQIPESFNHPSRGLFDPDYVKALFDLGFRQAQADQAFSDHPPTRVSQRPTQ